ncbi:MAG TPA: sec-independent translocase [Propionibacteriaceae bacterium]|nr:sec-independent translocase [Propionibacteriaceae bacterium]
MFGIGVTELVFLVMIAVVMFGPERIPEFTKKAARVVHFLRTIANTAQDQLRTELGPEFADLSINDLRPRMLIQKHILNDIQADLDGIKGELEEVKNDLNEVSGDISATAGEVSSEFSSAMAGAYAGPGVGVAFDPEAT